MVCLYFSNVFVYDFHIYVCIDCYKETLQSLEESNPSLSDNVSELSKVLKAVKVSIAF